MAAACVIVFDYRSKEDVAMTRALQAAERLGIVDLDVIMRLTKDQRQAIVDLYIKNKKGSDKDFNVHAPIEGKTMSLKDTNDSTFANKVLGEGLAIEPKLDSKTIVAPVNGEVKSVATSNHAVTILSETGVGVLIHVGTETINVGGKGLASVVKAGDKVKIGDEILKVDFKAVKDSGVKDIPVIVTVVNSTILSDVHPIEPGIDIKPGVEIIHVAN